MKINVAYSVFRMIGSTLIEIYADFPDKIDGNSVKKLKIAKK